MKYELAKELKGAGFPQTWEDGKSLYTADGIKLEPIRRSDDVLTEFTSGYVCPSLPELIEMCGSEFYTLVRVERHEWYATTYRAGHKGGYNLCGNLYLSAEEAVARLWLALNRTNTTN